MNPTMDKWQRDFEAAKQRYKEKGYSDEKAWSYACDRANDAWRTEHPINGSDDRSMYGPT